MKYFKILSLLGMLVIGSSLQAHMVSTGLHYASLGLQYVGKKAADACYDHQWTRTGAGIDKSVMCATPYFTRWSHQTRGVTDDRAALLTGTAIFVITVPAAYIYCKWRSSKREESTFA